jgi:hypothetical protein
LKLMWPANNQMKQSLQDAQTTISYRTNSAVPAPLHSLKAQDSTSRCVH